MFIVRLKKIKTKQLFGKQGLKENLKDPGKIKEANRDVKAREGSIQIKENYKTEQKRCKCQIKTNQIQKVFEGGIIK